MDPATIIGLVLAFGALFAMITLEGSHVTAILLPAPMILVFGATLAVGLAGGTLKDFVLSIKAIPRAFSGRTPDPVQAIESVVTLAEKARREGLLALEQDAAEAQNPFLRTALQNIADGTDGEELRILLEDEIATKAATDKVPVKFFNALGGYAPTIGIIGTVVSLTHVLENLDTPATLGPMIATAFVATLWGLLSANFLWLPISTRLKRLADLETDEMVLLMEGVLALQAGSQPRLLGERLRAMVPAHALAGPKESKETKNSKDSAATQEAA